MSKHSKSGNGNMLLLAGLGVGAFILFANKSNAQSSTANVLSPAVDNDIDIPTAPKILAVNTSASESPLPTAIVSDDDGMVSATANSGQSQQSNVEASSDDESDIGPTAQSGTVPALVSTKLTDKEKAVINKGVLSDDLAIRRPDLYKAIYIKKHGKNGNGQKALKSAEALIQSIQRKRVSRTTSSQKKKRKVAIKLNPSSSAMILAAAQASGGGMSTLVALNTVNALQAASGGAKGTIKKGAVHRAASGKSAHPGKKVHHSSGKHPVQKHKVHHKAASHK